MTSEELGSIRAHLAAVSPYPWRGDSDDGARMRRAVVDANGDLVVFGSDHDGDPYYGIHEAPGQEYAPNEALIIQAPVYVAALLDEMARLTAEVARLEAMAPRWAYTHRGRMWRLYCCGVRLLDSGLSAFPGELVLDTTTGDEYPDLATACAAVCARLGLHDIKPPENTNV